jgi:hypothetical protein
LTKLATWRIDDQLNVTLFYGIENVWSSLTLLENEISIDASASQKLLRSLCYLDFEAKLRKQLSSVEYR